MSPEGLRNQAEALFLMVDARYHLTKEGRHHDPCEAFGHCKKLVNSPAFFTDITEAEKEAIARLATAFFLRRWAEQKAGLGPGDIAV